MFAIFGSGVSVFFTKKTNKMNFSTEPIPAEAVSFLIKKPGSS